MSRAANIRTYDTIIRQNVLYGSETQIMNQQEEKKYDIEIRNIEHIKK